MLLFSHLRQIYVFEVLKTTKKHLEDSSKNARTLTIINLPVIQIYWFFSPPANKFRKKSKKAARYDSLNQKHYEALPCLKSFILIITNVPISRSVSKHRYRLNEYSLLLTSKERSFLSWLKKHFYFPENPVILTIVKVAYF